MIIAIDGPSASGKSTTAKLVAEQLNLLYLDTGAMYRAVALYLQQRDICIDDYLALESALEQIDIRFEIIDNSNHIFLDGVDVTETIRTPEITKMSSAIAIVKIVRTKMVDLQRSLSVGHEVVLDGRDIGTVVFPDADFKFFMVASLESRSQRRYLELVAKGIETDIDTIRQDLIWRDQNDSSRSEAPLKKAHDAIEIDTTNLSVDEQVALIVKRINRVR
jgi:cytidylate kinase